MTTPSRKIMIVAGEASGDVHAAKLVLALRDSEPGVDHFFFGAAGPRMRAAGVKDVVRSDELSVVGVIEIGSSLRMFKQAFNKLKDAAAKEDPDIVILVDFPEFNLKLAKALKKNGFKIAYYISPQLWAWRKYRISAVKKYVDLMLTILPFEKDWYRRNGVEHVKYVGNPSAKEVHASLSKEDFCRAHDLDISKPIVSLLPGSRSKEIERILPVLLASAAKIESASPDVQFLVALAATKDTVLAEHTIEQVKKTGVYLPASIQIVVNDTYNALNASDAAAVTSGTATLETGIIGTPMVIVYKSSTVNAALLRPLISVEHFGLINLVADERIAKELIQNDLTPDAVSTEILRLLDGKNNAAMRAKLRSAIDKLGDGGAAHRAAEAVLSQMDKKLR